MSIIFFICTITAHNVEYLASNSDHVPIRKLTDFSQAYQKEGKLSIECREDTEVFIAHPVRNQNFQVFVKKILKESDECEAEITFHTLVGQTNSIPGIPKIYDLVETTTHYFVVMQWFKGITVDNWVVPTDQTLKEVVDKVLHYILKAARIMSSLHAKNVVHRDLHERNSTTHPPIFAIRTLIKSLFHFSQCWSMNCAT